jgi:hypothetical protein
MNLVRLVWDGNEGHAVFEKDYQEADRVVQLDALHDWIFDLKAEYDRLIVSGGALETRQRDK